MEGIEQFQEDERECVKRFRQKAQEIRAAHPELSAQIAFARAVQSLPRTAEKYSYARQRLQFCGIPALPLR